MRYLPALICLYCYLQLQTLCYGNPLLDSSLFGSTRMPRLKSLDVKCGRSGMAVHVEFDLPFNGVIYSKGHFYDPSCNYAKQQDTGQKSFSFMIPMHSCGTSGNLEDSSTADGEMYIENTIILQNDPLIQEIWDQARRLKCTWQNTISKSVAAAPFSVEDPEMVSLQLDSKSINTVMKIQRGSSPFTSPATGYINVGEDASIVIYVQEIGSNLDANVVSCKAISGQGDSVPLIDSTGCLVRPDLLSPFYKMRQPNEIEADLMFFSYLTGFRIGESMEFRISCQLEVCENKCLEPCALGPLKKRRKREAPLGEALLESPNKLVELQRGVIVISRPFENDDHKLKNCSLNDFAGVVVALFVILFAIVCALTSYLALRLHRLQKQIKN